MTQPTFPDQAPPDAGSAGSASVDDAGLSIPRGVSATVDVLFDGQRVWSFSPEELKARGAAGSRRVPWPKLLKPHLDGSTHVVLREHTSEAVLLATDHAFGTADRRLSFVDGQGIPKVIDKWGFVQKPLSSREASALEPVLDATQAILSVLTDGCGLPAWIAFGSLLGAVREGKVIAHDNDLDVAYLSAYENPVDVTREMFRVTRALQDLGMKVLIKTGSFVTVIAKLPGGGQVPVDVYACFYLGDVLYESASVGTPVPRDAVLPLGTVTLEGREFPAPADPQRLLEVSYGAGWATPDPGFRYHIPPALKRRFLGWFGSAMRNRRYWDRLYEGAYGYQISNDPSPFAEWVLPQLTSGQPLLDVGCGNGRDTMWFAANGIPTTGLDYSRGTMVRCRAEAAERGLPITFTLLNFYDLRDTLVRGRCWAAICRRRGPSTHGSCCTPWSPMRARTSGGSPTWRFAVVAPPSSSSAPGGTSTGAARSSGTTASTCGPPWSCVRSNAPAARSSSTWKESACPPTRMRTRISVD